MPETSSVASARTARLAHESVRTREPGTRAPRAEGPARAFAAFLPRPIALSLFAILRARRPMSSPAAAKSRTSDPRRSASSARARRSCATSTTSFSRTALVARARADRRRLPRAQRALRARLRAPGRRRQRAPRRVRAGVLLQRPDDGHDRLRRDVPGEPRGQRAGGRRVGDRPHRHRARHGARVREVLAVDGARRVHARAP